MLAIREKTAILYAMIFGSTVRIRSCFLLFLEGVMFMYCKTCRHRCLTMPAAAQTAAHLLKTPFCKAAHGIHRRLRPAATFRRIAAGVFFPTSVFGTHPHFRCAQLVFCAFPRKPGACAVSFLRVLFGADAHHHEHLKPRARLYTVCAGHDLRRAAIYRHHLLCADDPRHRKRRFRQSKGAAVHRPYSPFEITVHSKIALRNFLSQGIFIREFRKTVAHKVDICYTA